MKKAPKQLEGFLMLGDAVILTDKNQIILDVNREFQSVTGYSKQEIIGNKPSFLKSNLTSKESYISLGESLKKGETWSGVFVNKKKSGALWHSSITITPIIIVNETYYVGVFRELEQLKKGVYLSEGRRMESQRELLRILAISCEIRDPGTEEHLVRVQNLTELLVKAHNERKNLNFSEEYMNNIIHSSILHDIGKAEIPEGILYKPGPLTTYERQIIEMHPLMGNNILNKISTTINKEIVRILEIAENIVKHHHEKWNGKGYPENLKGEKIPFEARVVALVDVYDALTSRRSYKEAWSKERALNLIEEERGNHFDPELVDTFLELARKTDEI